MSACPCPPPSPVAALEILDSMVRCCLPGRAASSRLSVVSLHTYALYVRVLWSRRSLWLQAAGWGRSPTVHLLVGGSSSCAASRCFPSARSLHLFAVGLVDMSTDWPFTWLCH